MITTKRISEGDYTVFENNIKIGIISFYSNVYNDDIIKKDYYLIVPIYKIRYGVRMIAGNFKNVEKAAVKILISFLIFLLIFVYCIIFI